MLSLELLSLTNYLKIPVGLHVEDPGRYVRPPNAISFDILTAGYISTSIDQEFIDCYESVVKRSQLFVLSTHVEISLEPISPKSLFNE